MRRTKDGCPIRLHRSGQWTVIRSGRQHYLGRDKATALERYRALVEIAPEQPDVVRLRDLCNHFLDYHAGLVKSGELTQRRWDTLHRICGMLIDALGRTTPLVAITPAHFTTLRRAWSERFKPSTIGFYVTITHQLFKYGERNGLCGRMLFGELVAPRKEALHRTRNPRIRVLAPSEIRRLLDLAKPVERAAVLLAINCAFNPADTVALQLRHVDGEWLRMARVKTCVERRCWLWPETQEAIRDVGLPIPFRCSALTSRLKWLFGVAGIDATANSLRHTCLDRMAQAGDQAATRAVAGHADQSMLARYVHGTDDDRIRRACEHVRSWLWPSPPTAGQQRGLRIVG